MMICTSWYRSPNPFSVPWKYPKSIQENALSYMAKDGSLTSLKVLQNTSVGSNQCLNLPNIFIVTADVGVKSALTGL